MLTAPPANHCRGQRRRRRRGDKRRIAAEEPNRRKPQWDDEGRAEGAREDNLGEEEVECAQGTVKIPKQHMGSIQSGSN